MSGDLLVFAAAVSFIMGIHSFTLPHTPPRTEATSPWAVLESLKMLKDRNFAIFLVICFVVATELQFYYVFDGSVLGGLSDRDLRRQRLRLDDDRPGRGDLRHGVRIVMVT